MRFIIFFLAVLTFAPVYGNNILFGPPVVVTATTVSTKVLDANGKRTYLIIVNRGAVTAIVKFGSVQSGTEGIPIPAGGSYEPIQAPANSIYAVTGSSSAALTIVEGN